MPDRTVEIRCIAHAAGVSFSTVSLALRGSAMVTAETREKVMREAVRFGYRTDSKLCELYRQIRLSRSGASDSCLAVVIVGEEHFELDRWNALYLAMRNRASRYGYRLEIFSLDDEALEPTRLRTILKARGIRGLVFVNLGLNSVKFPPELTEISTICVGGVEGHSKSRVRLDRFQALFSLLDRIKQAGFIRPALCFEDCSDEADTIYRSAYLGWCYKESKSQGLVPFLSLLDYSQEQLNEWIVRNRPDALIGIRASQRFHTIWEKLGKTATDKLLLATLERVVRCEGVVGIVEDLNSIGLHSIELLVDSVENSGTEMSTPQCSLMLEGAWVNQELLLT